MAKKGYRVIEAAGSRFAASARKSIPISTDSAFAALVFRALYSFTHAGTTSGTAHDSVAWRLLREWSLKGRVGNRSVTFANGYPADFGDILEMLEPRARPQLAPDFGSVAGTQETALYSTLPLRVDMIGSKNPGEGGIPGKIVSGLELVVDGAEPTDLMYGEDETAGDAAFNGPAGTGSVETEVLEHKYLSPTRLSSPLFQLSTSYEITSDQVGRRFKLPEVAPGMEIVRAFLATDVDGVPTDAVLDNLGFVVDNADPFEKHSREFYQDMNQTDYNLSARKTGRVMFDFAEGGDFTDLWKVRSTETPYISADVEYQASAIGGAGVNELRIVAHYIDRRAQAGRR